LLTFIYLDTFKKILDIEPNSKEQKTFNDPNELNDLDLQSDIVDLSLQLTYDCLGIGSLSDRKKLSREIDRSFQNLVIYICFLWPFFKNKFFKEYIFLFIFKLQIRILE
jgi:hypothetical protein